MNIPEGLKYTKSHEWALLENNKVKVGITDFAQKELTDIVFVELPELQKETEQGKECAVIESVKTAVDIYAPLSGKIVEINSALEETPEAVNSEPYGQGWMFVIEMSKPAEVASLLSAEDYKQEIGE